LAEHTLYRKQHLKLPRAKVFEFFSDAKNLELITPPELNFKITTLPPKISKGALIDYKLSLRGFPITWRTLISEWDPPHSFTDESLKGPYTQWIHQHRFSETENGETLIEDAVKYRLPFEPFGDLAHWFVKRELKFIFDFRRDAVVNLLNMNV